MEKDTSIEYTDKNLTDVNGVQVSLERSSEKEAEENENEEPNEIEGPLVPPSDMPIVTWMGRLIQEDLSKFSTNTRFYTRKVHKLTEEEEDKRFRKSIRLKTLAAMKKIKSSTTGNYPYDFCDSGILEELQKMEAEENVPLSLPAQKVLSPEERSIELEKYRRNQAYSTLNYLLSNVTYANFFTHDVMVQIGYAQTIARKRRLNNFTGEQLVLGILDSDCEVKRILADVGITRKTFEKTIADLKFSPDENVETNDPSWVRSKLRFLQSKFQYIRTHRQEIFEQSIKFSKIFYREQIFPYFSRFLHQIDCITSIIANWVRQKIDPTLPPFALPIWEEIEPVWIPPSPNVYRMFERAAYLALEYKTPVIGSEILFLVLLENQTTRSGIALRTLLKNPANFLSLRYKLLKRVWRNKSHIMQQVKSNQHFFAFLLQADLSGIAFDQLVETKDLADAVNLYRNELIKGALEVDIWPLLVEESYLSMFSNLEQKFLERKAKEKERRFDIFSV